MLSLEKNVYLGLQGDTHNRPETHAGSQLIALSQRHSVSLLRFESPDSNPRGLVLPRPEPRWTYQVEAQFIARHPMCPSVQTSYRRYGKFLGRARLI
jgi:hypothetical protein